MLKLSYDKEGDILEIKFSDEAIKDSSYSDESGIIVDYDSNNAIVAIEVTSFSKRVGKSSEPDIIAI